VTADRAERSVLATPGSNLRMIAKALATDADVVMIDLEDAVAPDTKAAARSTVAQALLEGDWRGRPRTFRMNALDTPWFVRDLVEVIEGAQGRVDLIVMPKVGRPEDVHVVATILASLEVAAGRNIRSRWRRRSRVRLGWRIVRRSPRRVRGSKPWSSDPETMPRQSVCRWRQSA